MKHKWCCKPKATIKGFTSRQLGIASVFYYVCSNCECPLGQFYDRLRRFCPNCGAMFKK